MSKRARFLVLALVVAGAACNKLPTPTVNLNAGVTFVPQVADSIDNVGLGSQVALDANGIPYISYVGIPAVYTAKQIPVSRLPSQPFVPGILIASVDKGIWTRGAAAMVKPRAGQPNPVTPKMPFSPAALPSLANDLKVATQQNGTSIAVGSNGSVDVAWTDATGVWFDGSANGATGTMGTPVNVVPHKQPLTQAGPVGWPSVAEDSSDSPSIAVTTTSSRGQVVEYLAPRSSSSHWRKTIVSALAPCKGSCEQPQRTVNLQTPSGPVILYVDTTTHAVMEATQQGKGWTTQTVESGISGQGLAGTVAPDGTIVASYYSGKGEVHVARLLGSGWQVSTAGSETDASADQTALATTGVAVDGKGTIFVTWYDAATDAVKLVSGDGTTFTPMKTLNTQHSGAPSLAVTKDGGVQLAWYAETPQDLYLGSLESTSGLLVAQPSPTPSPPTQVVSSPSGGCPSGDTQVIAAPGAASSGYKTTQVTVTSGTVTVCFNNEDAVQHNVNVTTDKAQTNSLGATTIITGPATAFVTIKNLTPGTYYYHCDVHPTVMTGTLTVK